MLIQRLSVKDGRTVKDHVNLAGLLTVEDTVMRDVPHRGIYFQAIGRIWHGDFLNITILERGIHEGNVLVSIASATAESLLQWDQVT